MLSSIRNLLQRRLTRDFPSLPLPRINSPAGRFTLPAIRAFSASSGDGGAKDDQWGNAWGGAAGAGGGGGEGLDWGESPSWSAGLTREHFDGEAVGRRVEDSGNELREQVRSMDVETHRLLMQVYEPGARGACLKDSEKAEMYRLHKENPEVNTVEKLANDYRIMLQRVHAILWLKELEAEEEKKRGAPLDDSIEILLDNFPEFFNSHDLEFHVASLTYKPDFKVMPEGWDGTTRDPDEVLYEISMKEDKMLYEEFVQRFEFNKKKMAGEVKCHKYSRRRPSEGWKFTIEKLGPRDKRGSGGGLKFVSLPDGSSRKLNEMEKMFVKRETPKKRRILPPFK